MNEMSLPRGIGTEPLLALCEDGLDGGNGYAVEHPIGRVLYDARIPSIFEGAAEIQAEVIGRGLLSQRN